MSTLLTAMIAPSLIKIHIITKPYQLCNPSKYIFNLPSITFHHQQQILYRLLTTVNPITSSSVSFGIEELASLVLNFPSSDLHSPFSALHSSPLTCSGHLFHQLFFIKKSLQLLIIFKQCFTYDIKDTTIDLTLSQRESSIHSK